MSTRSSSLLGPVRALPVALTGTVAALMAVAIWLAIDQRDLVVDAPVPDPEGWFVTVQVTSALVWLLAALAFAQRRDLSWWRLSGVAAMSHAAAALCHGWAVRGLVADQPAVGATVAATLPNVLLPVEVPIMVYLVVTLPSGRLGRAAIDWWGRCAVGLAAAGVVANAVSEPDAAGTDFAAARNPVGFVPYGSPLVPLLLATGALGALGVVFVRWRRSHGWDRLALRWVAWTQLAGTVLVVPMIALTSPAVGVGVAQAANVVVLTALVAVIRRQHLLGVERLFERTLQVALLAGILAAVYVAIVAGLTSLVDGTVARPVATAVVAVAVLPARDRLARLIGRFVYGDRANTGQIVAEIARAATSAASARHLLVDAVEQLRAGTGLRSATLEIAGHDAVSVGRPADARHAVIDIDLIHRGEAAGHLRLCGDDTDELDPITQTTAAEVAPHLALLADAYRSDADLHHARARLVQGREEERRRLRRDLHDGLGPILTGAAFSADAATNLIASDPGGAAELVAATRHDITTALDEIRRIVEDLRPPALDELGLSGAIRQHAHRFPALTITVNETTDLGPLPAATEVAAYRIATEALTNTARHADATSATVDISHNGQLCVTISDNGTAHTKPWTPGVGLHSMHQRAAELGGTFHAGPNPDGGHCITAQLPT
ncbi:MAG: histidine kinase [Acidimicrobiia bacterium]|nr:histidine kinase [Acidimicrobiia bacterium]